VRRLLAVSRRSEAPERPIATVGKVVSSDGVIFRRELNPEVVVNHARLHSDEVAGWLDGEAPTQEVLLDAAGSFLYLLPAADPP